MPSQRQAKRHKPSKPSQRSSDRANKALILLVDVSTRELLLIYSAKHTGWGGFHAKQGGFHAAAAKCESQVGFTPKTEHILGELLLKKDGVHAYVCMVPANTKLTREPIHTSTLAQDGDIQRQPAQFLITNQHMLHPHIKFSNREERQHLAQLTRSPVIAAQDLLPEGFQLEDADDADDADDSPEYMMICDKQKRYFLDILNQES